MAITADFYMLPDGQTPHSWSFLATHNGAAGDSLTITNAQLMTQISKPGPLRTLLSQVYASSSEARSLILEGNDSDIPGDPDSRGLDVILVPRPAIDGEGVITLSPWGANISVDGDGLPQLLIYAVAASSCLVRLSYRFSVSR